MTMPTFDAEDFAQWQEHMVTRAFFAYLEREAMERRERWTAQSFDSTDVNPVQAAQLRGEHNGLLTARDAEYGALFPSQK